MIEHLKLLGLSDLEARCYLALHDEAGISGYEVAKRVSVSRTNVYAALRSLLEKGIIRQTEADPVLYDAVPIQEVVRYLQSSFDLTAKTLIKELTAPPRSNSSFYNWQGADALQTALHRMIANAQEMVIADFFAEDVPVVEQALLQAEERGVTVVLISLGEVATRLTQLFVHKRGDDWPDAEARKFSLLCDSQTAMLGSFGGAIKPAALETTHPAVAAMLKNAFYHDMLMQRIEADFKDELTEKYGEHYEKLLHHFVHEKGWKL